MVEYGMKPMEAIRAATADAAELLGLGSQTGSVAAGYWADIIAVEGDPLRSVNALENVKFVMKEGKIYRNDWSGR